MMKKAQNIPKEISDETRATQILLTDTEYNRAIRYLAKIEQQRDTNKKYAVFKSLYCP